MARNTHIEAPERQRLSAIAVSVAAGTTTSRDPHGRNPLYGSTGRIGSTNRTEFTGPSILVARVGANAGSVYTVDGSYGVTDNTLVIRLMSGHSVSFIAELLRHAELNRMVYGSGQPLVTGTMLKHLAIPAFSHDEQTSISAALKDATSHSAILEQTISKKQAVKRGMMQQLLTGRVRLPGFAGPWSEGIFEQLAIPSRQRAMPRDVPPATLLVELEHLESGTGRLHGRSQAGEAVSLKAVFKPGDVLFGKLRAYLRKYWYADAAGLCTTEIWVLRACTGVCDRFVRYVVESDQFIDAASGAYGTHMPRSDWGMIRGLSVDIPPYEEQVTIASALDAVDTEIGVLLARLAKARDVKQGMMQQLLTGRTLLPVKEHAA